MLAALGRLRIADLGYLALSLETSSLSWSELVGISVAPSLISRHVP